MGGGEPGAPVAYAAPQGRLTGVVASHAYCVIAYTGANKSAGALLGTRASRS